MTKIKVLYIGAGNPLHPSAGMDIVSRAHIEELLREQRLDVKALVAHHSSVAANAGDAPSSFHGVNLFSSDLAEEPSKWRRLALKVDFVLKGGLLDIIDYRSTCARRKIVELLSERPQVVVIDHVAAMSNVSLMRILYLRVIHKTNIIFISHDITAQIIFNAAALKSGFGRQIFSYFQSLQSFMFEAALLYLSNRIVFISDFDRLHFHFVPRRKCQALCPVIDVSREKSAALRGRNNFFIFIGGVSFQPNAHAIHWIIDKFAPELESLGSSLQICLVGKGTELLDLQGHKNVRGLGFVPDADLTSLLRSSCGLLSPVIHGGGLKIKILEAVAAGCPIFATEFSLRGYEFLKLSPVLDIERPASSAQVVLDIAENPNRLAALEEQIRENWEVYRAQRMDRLSSLVVDLAVSNQCH